MPFHASTVDDYRRLTQVATPPPKGLYIRVRLIFPDFRPIYKNDLSGVSPTSALTLQEHYTHFSLFSGQMNMRLFWLGWLHVKSRAHNILYLKLRTYTAEAQSELALADYAQASLYYSILFFTPLFFTYYCFHCSYYTSTMLTDVSFKMTNWQHFTGDYSKVNIFRGLYCNTASFPALQGKVGNCNILAVSSGKSTSNMQESLPIRLA